MTVSMQVTELQFVDSRINSDKFYRVFVHDMIVITQYGRNGTYGTFGRKVLTSTNAADSEGSKVVNTKLGKGYEVTRSGTLTFPSAPTDSELDRAASRMSGTNAPPPRANSHTDNVTAKSEVDKAMASIMNTARKRTAAVDPAVAERVTAALGRHFKARDVGQPSGPTRPMLAETIDPADVEDRLTSPFWACQPKLDGDRVVIEVVDGAVLVLNRSGQPKVKNVSDSHLAVFTGLGEGRWVFDGEVVGRKLWLFDMPAAGPYHAESAEFSRRHLALVLTLDALGVGADHEHIGLVVVTSGTEDKRELLRTAQEAGKEGIIFREVHAAYSPARRSPDLLKYKFLKDADCEVVALDPKKQSAVLGVHDGNLDSNQNLTIVGNASTIGKGAIEVGDVVEVRYLYVTNAENPRMYQPRILRVRTDKAAADCSLDQFKNAVTDKTVDA